MTAIQFDFGAWDIPHIGALFGQIRNSRNITQSDLAAWLRKKIQAKKAVHSTLISNFEHPLQTNPKRGKDSVSCREVARAKATDHFACLMEALQQREIEGKPVRMPLKPGEAAWLQAIYAQSNDLAKVETAETQLMAFDFHSTQRRPYLQKVDGLLQQLQTETRPAFIADQLWFIHAINGAAYNLFGIDPTGDYTRRWEAWHVLGAKFLKDSPVLRAHVSVNEYYPQTIYYFFKDIYPFLFTAQMRALLAQLHRLSLENGRTDFERWWGETVTFSLAWHDEPLTRSIKYWGENLAQREDAYTELRAAADERYPQFDNFLTAPKDRYWLGVWNARDALTRITFADLRGRVQNNRQIFFAADYDDGRFHVNQWPGVRDYLLSVDREGETLP